MDDSFAKMIEEKKRKDEETIKAHLIEAEYIVGYVARSYGKAVPPEAREKAIGFQTAFMLKNCGDPEDYCLEVSGAAMALISMSG